MEAKEAAEKILQILKDAGTEADGIMMIGNLMLRADVAGFRENLPEGLDYAKERGWIAYDQRTVTLKAPGCQRS